MPFLQIEGFIRKMKHAICIRDGLTVWVESAPYRYISNMLQGLILQRLLLMQDLLPGESICLRLQRRRHPEI